MAIDTDKPRRRSVTVNGVKLSILEAGQGAPVIYVHGVVTTSNIFTKYVGAYSPDFRGIAVDLRGYGDSEKPTSGFNLDLLLVQPNAKDIFRGILFGIQPSNPSPTPCACLCRHDRFGHIQLGLLSKCMALLSAICAPMQSELQ